MLKKRYIGAAVACALAMSAWSGSALAAPQNVDGVIIDSSSPINLTIDAINFRESSVSAPGDVLTGYGTLASINGTHQSEFCPGCDIGFNFSYTVKSIDNSGANPQIVFDNGLVNFYVDNTQSFDVLDPSSATKGSLWLSLTGHAAPYGGYSDTGELYSTVFGPVSQPGFQSGGFGLLDASGGSAMSYFDVNTQADGADFSFSSSFLTKVADGCTAGSPSSDPNSICHYPISGTAELISQAPAAVPEPATIGMMGLGLGFLGLALRRRRKESDDRA